MRRLPRRTRSVHAQLTQRISLDPVKYGYPPKAVPADNGALLASIPITKGDQIVVTQSASSASSAPTASVHHSTGAPLPNPAVSGFMGRPAGPPLLRQSAPIGRPQPPAAAAAVQTQAGAQGVNQPVVIDLPDGNGVMNHGGVRRGCGVLQMTHLARLATVIVPDDNSCLFSSIATIFLGGMGVKLVASLRQGGFAHGKASAGR